MERPPSIPGASLSSHQIAKMSEVRHFTQTEYKSLKLVHPGDEGTAYLKVFRDIRTQLMKRAEWGNFICMVSSVVMGGGSHVAANLAATIALDKNKTSLYVDANLYHPYGEHLLPVPAQLGLTDYLEDSTIGTEDVVYASGVPRMRVVPIGHNREGGTEKLNSVRIQAFFNEIKQRYLDRYIILDAPSATEYEAENRILEELADYVVLVVPYGKATTIQIDAAIERVDPQKLAGVVYNWC